MLWYQIDRTRPNFHFGIRTKSCACPTPGKCRAQMTFLPFLFQFLFKISLDFCRKFGRVSPVFWPIPKFFTCQTVSNISPNSQNVSSNQFNSNLQIFNWISEHILKFSRFKGFSTTLPYLVVRKLWLARWWIPRTSMAWGRKRVWKCEWTKIMFFKIIIINLISPIVKRNLAK